MSGPGEKSTPRIAHQGRCGSIVFAQVRNGTYPSQEFWDLLGPSEQAKFMAQFRAITDNPQLQLRNRQQFKPVEGELFEFKRNDLQMRIFTFRRGNSWYLVSGLTGKKEDDLPEGDVARAKTLMQEAQERLNLPVKGKRQ